MDTILQTQFSRIESGLKTLIESIAAYNPSIPAASALLAADDELKSGLKQLAIHQDNHARIQQLRAEIDQRNENITATLRSIAATRTDLLKTQTSLPAKDKRKVEYEEVLGYAKRISRFTVPPNFRLPIPAKSAPSVIVNGNGDGGDVTMNEEEQAAEGEKEGRGTDALEDAEKDWLDPLKQMPWVPWVSDQVLRSGALAEIQAMVEKGEDPETMLDSDTNGGGEEKDDGGESMEGIQLEATRSADTAKRRVERREEKPKVFAGLDLYDPDED